MKHSITLQILAVSLLAGLTAGCDRLGLNKQAVSPEVPSDQELERIRYMSVTPASDKVPQQYAHLEEAKTCGDLELAMRWNRPPNVEGGAFRKKMVYLTAAVPADLPNNSEVFVNARIRKGEILPSGSAGWYLRLRDGTTVQAIETADYIEKEEQGPQDSKGAPLVAPNRPGRALCGHGIYQGMMGKDPDQEDKKVPLIAMLFAVDRDK